MKKIVWISGLIAGVISLLGFMFTHMQEKIDFEKGMIYGYTSMLLAFSLIFVAVKNYRDKYAGGSVSFGKAFRIGLYISLIASTVYVGVWLVDYYCFIPDFFEKYTAHIIEQMKASGATQAALDAKIAEMEAFAQSYRNPFFNAMMTYMEILPIGLLISLISAAILKRKARV